ncbi:PREDICTED: uncharacterized protein LOC109326241 isoform X1 [Lupinus angustifolius]|uniref:uncharacterized protein LOC109326241 isoform X1 n=1 Tax=Lupinus angustifolius TaxID=3871 RepID=UPI00092EE7C0|nr:PREDICTED: uncharacterized protein LOC109326241 isoform X1 [Lupinus angustifolius]
MDISSSQYNSGSESGWTHYLDQSYISESHFQRGGIVDYVGKGTMMEEEEDLSMVSDASSGPPHYCVDWYPSTSQYTKETEKKKRVKEYGTIQQPSLLDDTASSPALNCHKNFSGNGAVENALDYSQSLSASRTKSLQRKPKIKKHFSFFKRSLDGKQASEEPDEEEKK